MKSSDYRTLQNILKHKDYFDSRLIEIVKELQNKDKTYIDNIELYKLGVKQLTIKSNSLDNDLRLAKDKIIHLQKNNEDKDEKKDLIKIIDSLKD